MSYIQATNNTGLKESVNNIVEEQNLLKWKE